MKGYLVKYTTGSYDDYFEHCVAVYLDENEAKKRCKEIDKEHLSPNKGLIGEDEWDQIMEKYWDAYDEWKNSETLQIKYPDLLGKEKYNYEGWEKDHQRSLDDQSKLKEDTVMSFYPDWSREFTKEQIELRENYERTEYEEYGSAFIEEIEVIGHEK